MNSRGTEITINNYPNLNVVFGTMDKNNPKSIYIRISGWGNPLDYDENYDYKSIIRRINKRIKTLLYNKVNINNFDNNRIIIDLDMRDSGILEDKSSFMSCEITVSQHNHYLINSDRMLSELNNIASMIIYNVFTNNEYFKFYKKKKDAKSNLKPA